MTDNKKFIRIFASHFVKYLLAFSIIFAVSIMVFFIAKDTIKDYILDQTRTQLQDGTRDIEETTQKMQLISQMMYQDSDFATLCSQGVNYSQKNLLQLRNCYSQLHSISNVGHYATYMFALFAKNDFFLSNYQCSNAFSKYYNNYMVANLPGERIGNAQQLRSLLFESYEKGHLFIRLDSFQYMLSSQEQLDDPIVFLANGSTSLNATNHIFCFLMNKELLIDSILTAEFEQDGFLVIQDLVSGNELLSHGQVPEEVYAAVTITDAEIIENYYIMQISQDSLKWRITLGIPAAYIARQMMPVQNTLIICLLLGIAGVLILTICLSLSRYRGFRQVLHSIPEEEIVHPDSKHVTDYKLLSTNMSNLSIQNQSYRTQADILRLQNRAIMLEYFIKKGENTPAERQAFVEYIGKEPAVYCVAMVRSYAADFDTNNTAVLEMLDHLEKSGTTILGSVHSGMSDELFLIEFPSVQEVDMARLISVFEEMSQLISGKYACVLHVGISAVATDLAAISKCYGQAKRIIQSLYMSENENTVQVHAPADSLQENPITLDLMTHLYTTLICGRYAEAERELSSIEEFYKRMPYLYETCREQIFYSLKNLFHTVVMYLNCEDFQQQIPVYSESLRCGQIISAYKAYAAWICDYIAQNKKSHNEGLKLKVLSIIHERFGDCELSAYRISQEVGITENYLSKFVKEQTGESFSAYLLRVRINKAREYLETTDYSNKEIAALTGFASVNTFYRNFQKMTGVSPKFYKKKGTGTESEE